MVKTKKNQILKRIRYKNKNWVFSAFDFTANFKRWEIDQALLKLEKEGKIIRILPGLYYYPEYSEILKEFVAPDIRKVADALARKYDWKIFPEGNTALNYLGLSTQIPARYIYISNGGSRRYKIGRVDLEFRHRVFTETTMNNENAILVVQAIKSLGKTYADTDFTKLLSLRFSYDEWIKIEKSAHKVVAWVLDVIKKAKGFAKNG